MVVTLRDHSLGGKTYSAMRAREGVLAGRTGATTPRGPDDPGRLTARIFAAGTWPAKRAGLSPIPGRCPMTASGRPRHGGGRCRIPAWALRAGLPRTGNQRRAGRNARSGSLPGSLLMTITGFPAGSGAAQARAASFGGHEPGSRPWPSSWPSPRPAVPAAVFPADTRSPPGTQGEWAPSASAASSATSTRSCTTRAAARSPSARSPSRERARCSGPCRSRSA